jgi:hypothetical protein
MNIRVFSAFYISVLLYGKKFENFPRKDFDREEEKIVTTKRNFCQIRKLAILKSYFATLGNFNS